MTPALSRRCSNQLSYRPKCGLAARNAEFRILNLDLNLIIQNPAFSIQNRAVGAGGGMGIRTPDIQLAKLALYQLSYTPLLPVRRGINTERKRSSCALRPAIGGRAEFIQIIFRSGVGRLPAPQARGVFQPQGLDLSQGRREPFANCSLERR